MKTHNKTILSLWLATLFAVIAVGIYIFFFVSMKDKTKSTSELSSKIKEVSGKESSISLSQKTIQNELANLEKLSTYFIKESKIVEFTQKIEALGGQSGTTLTLESIDPNVTEKSVSYLTLRVKATGKFENVMKLLVLLENLPGKFEVKTIRLISLDTHVAPPTTPAGKIVAKVANLPEWSAEVFLTAFNFIKE